MLFLIQPDVIDQDGRQVEAHTENQRQGRPGHFLDRSSPHEAQAGPFECQDRPELLEIMVV